MIEEDKYYSTPKISKLHPLFENRDYDWFLKQIKLGRLKAVNMNPDGIARYQVKGGELLRFLKELGD